MQYAKRNMQYGNCITASCLLTLSFVRSACHEVDAECGDELRNSKYMYKQRWRALLTITIPSCLLFLAVHTIRTVPLASPPVDE